MIASLYAAPVGQIHPDPFRNGCVVSDSMFASQVGADILKRGGNAVDAAIATGFALAVTFPAAGNIGGGGFMLVRMADGRTVAIDYRETAPRRATKKMYVDAKGNVTKDSVVGYRASGVPGTSMGMWEAHRRYGSLPWKQLVDPAVRLARDGFVLDRGLAENLRDSAKTFEPFKASWIQFCREGRFFEWGDRFRQPELAATLARIRDNGADGFYKGPTAAAISNAMNANGGLIDEIDLAEYKAVLREPIRGSYKGYDLMTMPPPSSGGICMLQMLAMLEPFDLRSMGWNSADALHLQIEAMKRSFADRSQYMGDPGFANIPITELLDPAYISRRRESIDRRRATPSNQIRPGLEPAGEGEHTTHFSVVDKEGNAVSNTYTLNTGFGSGVTIAGFLMNNEMDDFAAKVGVPNAYGLIQGESNTIAPGKRPLSSMTPTIVMKSGKVYAVLGSPGGPTIINTVMQSFLNMAEFGLSVQEAVAAPRFHHQWLPDEIRYEQYGLGAELRSALTARGHVFALRPGRMGSCHAIGIASNSVRLAGVDPRVPGAGAAGY